VGQANASDADEIARDGTGASVRGKVIDYDDFGPRRRVARHGRQTGVQKVETLVSRNDDG
jgi:hypothetical protein